jgi:hypothetical protein
MTTPGTPGPAREAGPAGPAADDPSGPTSGTGQGPTTTSGGSGNRWKYGLWALLGGIGALSLTYILTIYRFPVAADVATAIAPISTTIGSLAGAYFGIQAGSAGKQQSDDAKDAAHRDALRFAAIAEPTAAANLLGITTGPPAPGGSAGSSVAAPSGDDPAKRDRP